MNAASPCLDFFIRGTAPHPDDDRTRQDGIGQSTEAGDSHCAVCGDLLGFDLTAGGNATARDGAFAVSRIQEAPDLLILFRFRSEDSVDFVKEDGREALFVGDLTEKV